MAKLFIAEKPSLAKAIATGIGISQKQKNHFDCVNGDMVTWQFGHILEQFSPQDYDEKYTAWKHEDLPIIPAIFKLKPKSDKGAKAQLAAIKKLLSLKKTTEIVNAADPDREGQILVDSVLD